MDRAAGVDVRHHIEQFRPAAGVNLVCQAAKFLQVKDRPVVLDYVNEVTEIDLLLFLAPRRRHYCNELGRNGHLQGRNAVRLSHDHRIAKNDLDGLAATSSCSF